MYRSWSLGRSIRPDTQNQGAAAPDKVGDTMAKAVGFIEKHIQIIVMILSICSMVVGFYTSVQAQQNLKTNEKIGLEQRLTAIETQLKLITSHFKIVDAN